MLADNGHVVGLSVENFKDESKPHKCPGEIREDAELEIPKNKDNVCDLFYDTRSGNECDKENDENNALEHHSCGDSDVAGKMIRGKSQDTAANGGLCYMDKNVTACDLPEIVVCYNENTCHIVKDICVDEGVPVQEKFLFGEKDSVKCNSNSNQCESENLMKADKGPLEPKSSEDRNSKVDDSELCNDPRTDQGIEQSSREDFANAEGSSSCNQERLIVTRESKDEVAREDGQNPLNTNNIHRREEQTTSQLQENEQRSLETTVLETEEPRKAEEKLSSVSTTTSQEPERRGTDKKLPDLLVGESFEEDKLLSDGFGETSFSAAEAVSISGHISYSGPVVVSGRLSVRSDASTTSGRSFAFPIQNGTVVLKEWLKLRREDSKDGERSSSAVDSLDQQLAKSFFTFEAQRSKKGL